MTRKDYEAVAEVFAQVRALAADAEKRHGVAGGDLFAYGHAAGRSHATAQVAGALADVFAADNPRFDRGRFLSACGIIADDGDRLEARRALQVARGVAA